ncbi:MAG: ribosome small subunit-dependent GTPase A [Spirochaetales bacterium]
MKLEEDSKEGILRGTVLGGANNIFFIAGGHRTVPCYIKGKILKGTEEEYTPLSAGDDVLFQEDGRGKGRILKRLERKNRLARYNKKGDCPQTIASNIDQVLLVSSCKSPPFRPRFIDRVCVSAEAEKIPLSICLNKIDLELDLETKARLDDFARLGYAIYYTSVKNMQGMNQLKDFLYQKRTLLLGQSGTGKTSLLNVLLPGKERKVGPISEKYNRGTHTTVLAYLEISPEGWQVIDTPGVREFEPVGIPASELSWYFRDFLPYRSLCLYPNCTHTLEPECAILTAVEKNKIHPDRYESYLRLYFSLKERERDS